MIFCIQKGSLGPAVPGPIGEEHCAAAAIAGTAAATRPNAAEKKDAKSIAEGVDTDTTNAQIVL